MLTSVGGTTRSDLSADGDVTEVAAIFSGGGFSNHFERPFYQFEAVPSYFLELGDEHRGRYKYDHYCEPIQLFSYFQNWYSASGRGFPDIAAQATNIVGYVKGESLLEDSTSCATPVCLSSLFLPS